MNDQEQSAKESKLKAWKGFARTWGIIGLLLIIGGFVIYGLTPTTGHLILLLLALGFGLYLFIIIWRSYGRLSKNT
jgi:hypothetical protein